MSEASLFRTWLVGQSGVEHSAIPTALVRTDVVLLLEHRHSRLGTLLKELIGSSEADEACSDYDAVVTGHRSPECGG
jgi:hypothetical protein